MTPDLDRRAASRQRRLRHTAAGVGLVVLSAALGLIAGGLWRDAHRKAAARAGAPFTLGADLHSGPAASVGDEPPADPPTQRD